MGPIEVRSEVRLAVIGAGSMGAQIAQQAALHGVEVRLQDVSDAQLARAKKSNHSHLARRVEKGRLDAAAAAAALHRVVTTADLAEAAESADVVIEAIVEDLEAKRDLFQKLDRLAPAEAILATNSSTIGISKLAAVTERPELCCNMHFFYPPLVMDLVEVVKGPQTAAETVERARQFAHQIGRTAVVLNKEIDGFIVNRILHAATQEAYRLLDAGVASFEDIDIAVEKGLNWPMGPFRLGDFSGLDVTFNARLHMYRSTGDDRYMP